MLYELNYYQTQNNEECNKDMSRYDKIKFTSEEKKRMIEEIQEFFREERDENLGIIGAEDILNFVINTLGEEIYNKALDDARIWFKRNMENIEADFYISSEAGIMKKFADSKNKKAN